MGHLNYTKEGYREDFTRNQSKEHEHYVANPNQFIVIVSQEWYGFICNKSRPSMGRFDIMHIFPCKYYISYYHSHYVAVGILRRLITYSGFDSVFHRYLIYAINSLIIDSIHILMCDSLNDISTSGYISRRHTAYFLIWSNKGNGNGKNDEN